MNATPKNMIAHKNRQQRPIRSLFSFHFISFFFFFCLWFVCCLAVRCCWLILSLSSSPCRAAHFQSHHTQTNESQYREMEKQLKWDFCFPPNQINVRISSYPIIDRQILFATPKVVANGWHLMFLKSFVDSESITQFANESIVSGDDERNKPVTGSSGISSSSSSKVKNENQRRWSLCDR